MWSTGWGHHRRKSYCQMASQDQGAAHGSRGEKSPHLLQAGASLLRGLLCSGLLLNSVNQFCQWCLSLECSCHHLPGLLLIGHLPPGRQDSSHQEHCSPKHWGQDGQLLSAKATRWLEPTARVICPGGTEQQEVKGK